MYGPRLVVRTTGNETITLRPPTTKEVVYLLYRLCGPWAHPWLGVGGPIGLLREAFKTLHNPNDRSSQEWVIANEGDVMVGMVMLDQIDWNKKAGRLSYAVLPEFQKRGYASLAAGFVVGYGYDQLGLSRIWTRVLRGNEPSNKILAGLGFEPDPSQVSTYVERGISHVQDYGVIPNPRHRV